MQKEMIIYLTNCIKTMKKKITTTDRLLSEASLFVSNDRRSFGEMAATTRHLSETYRKSMSLSVQHNQRLSRQCRWSMSPDDWTVVRTLLEMSEMSEMSENE